MRAAIHFLVMGMALFAAMRALEGGKDAGVTERRRIVIDASRIEGIRRAYAVGMGVPPTPEEMTELLDRTVEEEVLFREALARGLERGDRAIGYRLVQKMRFLGEDDGAAAGALYEQALAMGLHLEDPVVRRILVQKMRLLVGHMTKEPTEAELAEYYETNRDKFAQAERVGIRHVFFDASRRGDEKAREQAAAAAASLSAGQAGAGGDPFIMGPVLAAQTEKDLTKLFGAAFAREVLAAAPGAWQGPIRSAYGWHVVQIESRRGLHVPELAAVRSQLERSLTAERARRRVEQFLSTARSAYQVTIQLERTGGDGDA